MFYTLNAMIYPGDKRGFVAECVELPVVTQGETLDEVVQNLREAVSLHINAPVRINYEKKSKMMKLESIMPETSSLFLQTARTLDLNGQSDWAAHLDDYLYGEKEA